MTECVECVECGRRSFYEKHRCLRCSGTEHTAVAAEDGELLAVTTVNVTPEGVREPNRLGLASFPGGAKVVAQVEGELSVGDAVSLTGDRDLRVVEDGVLHGSRLVAVE